MKTYEISKDYELLADLLESGAVIVKRFGGKPWTQFQATKQGKYTSFRGHGRASFISLCQMQNWEFIVPTVDMPEPVTRKQQLEMSKPKFTPGPWNVAPMDLRMFRITRDLSCWVDICRNVLTEENANLIATAPEMYESNALCLDETCVMQVAFTFACAKCEISKDTKCKDCPISAGMRTMFRQRDRIAKLQKKARGEE